MEFIHIILIIYLIAVNTIIGYKTKQSKKLAVIFSCAGIVAIQCMRGMTVGIDLVNYNKLMFVPISKMNLVELVAFIKKGYYETGFVIFNKIMSIICFNNWQLYLCSIAIIVNVIIAWFIYKYSDNPLLSYLIYMGIGLYIFSFSALRQIMAIAFTIVAFDRIYRKKYIRFFIWVFIAFLFHKSAIVFGVIFLVRNFRICKKDLPVFLIIMFIIFLFAKQIASAILSTFMPAYLGYLEKGDGLGLLSIFFALTYFLYFFANRDGNKNEVDFFMNVFLVAVLCQLFGNISSITGRITFYFSIYLMIIVPNSVNKGAIEDRSINQLTSLLYAIFGVCFLLIPGLLTNYLQVGNYAFFWQ
ncbi:MAG: EpsG family protein [Clostridia bacterium]